MQVAALTVGVEHNTHFDNLFKVCMNMLVNIIPQNTDITKAYESATSAEDQDFVQNLALFLTAFFKVRPPLLQGLPPFVPCFNRELYIVGRCTMLQNLNCLRDM